MQGMYISFTVVIFFQHLEKQIVFESFRPIRDLFAWFLIFGKVCVDCVQLSIVFSSGFIVHSRVTKQMWFFFFSKNSQICVALSWPEDLTAVLRQEYFLLLYSEDSDILLFSPEYKFRSKN